MAIESEYSAKIPAVLLATILCVFAFYCGALAVGQDYPPIRAANLANLKSQARINFADFPGELNIGWFEAKTDASEIIVFDRAGRLYRVSAGGIKDSWSYVVPGNGQLFSLIDATYIGDEPQVLYVLDGGYFINEQQLAAGREPVALVAYGQSLFVEAMDADGQTVFMQYLLGKEGDLWQLVGEFPMPVADPTRPAVRIGRIDFPIVLYSALDDGALKLYHYPDAFASDTERDYSLKHGPAVSGAVNDRKGSYFAWSDPHSARLNLLDLETGVNQVVMETDGAYAQYHLLTADASAILIVNLDFRPEVFAWDVETGRRFELGPYRNCQRIPDKVALSADGTSLIIGCDTGLDIWRVSDNEDSERG